MPDKPHQPDYVLYFTIVILCAVGVITAYSAGMDMALAAKESPDHFAIRQLAFAVAGLLVMFVFMRIHPLRWYKFAPLGMVLNFFLLVAVLMVGVDYLGGKRWLGTSTFHIQPSELAITAISMYLAFFFTKKVTLIPSLKQGFMPALYMVGFNVLLILIEPDMGTAMTLFGTAVIVMIAAGTPIRRIVGLGFCSMPALVYLLFFKHSYRSGRMLAFFDPFKHASSASYQLLAGWTAMANGGWFGKGFGMSLAKTGYLPESNTDFVFPIFVEEWGYIGAIALIAMLGVLIWRGFMVARHAPNRFMALFAVGLTSAIAMGTLINLGAVTGLLPVTGIPLPFITYGGTDLVVNLASMGMLVAISRYTLDEEPESDQLAEVIEVEDTLWKTPKASKLDDKPSAQVKNRPSASRADRPRASVQPIRSETKRKTAQSTTQSWRSRQEGTKEREKSKRSSTGTRTSSSAGGSWRERQQRAEQFQSRDGAGRRPTTSRGKDTSSRRDR